MHSSLQLLDPDSLHEQLFVHSLRVHGPLPEQSMLHPLPGHERLAGPEESARTVHPPAGHEKVHGPLPWHTNSQPAPGHDSEHGEDVTQKHGCPGVQLVELLVCVVATQPPTNTPTTSPHPTTPPFPLPLPIPVPLFRVPVFDSLLTP